MLISFIAGVVLLIIVGILLFAPIFSNKSGYTEISNSFRGESYGPLILFLIIALFISSIAAVVLNFLAYIMNDAKLTLTAAILFGGLAIAGFTFLIPVLPMVLCFIAFAQIKKQNKTI